MGRILENEIFSGEGGGEVYTLEPHFTITSALFYVPNELKGQSFP